jgi:hypothetical protein
MILLTGNRTMKGKNSLEQVLREENKPDSFPVLTIGNVDRIDDRDYRNRCADRIVEIALDIDQYVEFGRSAQIFPKTVEFSKHLCYGYKLNLGV